MTRIIAGRFKGRRLAVPTGLDIRPTTDRMRERLFSMLVHSRYPDMHGARVADLYAGTGALGLEALSRGAEHVTFVEKASVSIGTLKDNIQTLKAQENTTVLQKNASILPASAAPFDLIFMDPPYRKGLVSPTLNSILENGWLATGTIICELAANDDISIPSDLKIVDERSQGQQRIIFLQKG